MLPFLCEVTLCCIVSYHFALLVMKREPRSNHNIRHAGLTNPRATARLHVLPHARGLRPEPSTTGEITSKVTVP